VVKEPIALSTYVLTAFSVGTAVSESPIKVPSIENSLIVEAPRFNLIPSDVDSKTLVPRWWISTGPLAP